MEVHTHPHSAHSKKTWKQYFWEFLMLFLAVFCGFIAENIRERIVEHERAKTYAETMISDLSSDTLALNSYIKYWTYAANNVDTLFSIVI